MSSRGWTLTWTADEALGAADAEPSIFAVLEEQLGLKLVPAKGPVDTIVVDHAEQPSPNWNLVLTERVWAFHASKILPAASAMNSFIPRENATL